MENKKAFRPLDRFCLSLSGHRLVVLAVIGVITAVFLVGAFKIQGEVILQDMFPYDHEYLKLHARFSEIFGGGGSGVVIALNTKKGDIFNKETLDKIRALTTEVELWDEVYRVLTVSIGTKSVKKVDLLARGEISVTPLIPDKTPETYEEIEELKKHIFSDQSKSGVLVSEDGTAAIVLTEMKENIPYDKMFDKLQGIREKYSDDDTSIHIVGFPMLMGWIYSLKPQMYMVFAISAFGIALVLFAMFYPNLIGMIAPMVNALVLTIWGLGFIGFLGINFNPMLYVLAFLVGARMISNSTQITYRYFEEYEASGGDRLQTSYETMRKMLIPNFTAVITDSAGFLVLLLAKIVLMQHVAIIMSFWMMSIVLTAFLVPAVCNIIPLKVAASKFSKEDSMSDAQARAIMKLTHFSIGPRSKYIFGALIIALFVTCIFQMTKLKIGDPTPGSPVLWPDHPYNQDQVLINDKFDVSSENLVLYYEGEEYSIYDPIVVLVFQKFVHHMAQTLPDIYKTTSSMIGLGKTFRSTFRDGDPLYKELPWDEKELMGTLGYLKKAITIASLRRYIDIEMKRVQLTLYFSDHTSYNLLRIRDAAFDFFKTYPMKTENGEFKLAGGRIGMEIALNEEMKRSHLIIDCTVLGAIFILCVISFRSFAAGLMLTLPLILANCLAAAYMATANIGLSINTLPVAAIGVGVGVDFAIYFYSRCKEEFSLQGGDWSKTIIQSVCTCGKAVVYTGVTIILPILTWYFFSDMKFQAEVGFFLAMIMGANVIFALTLHPLLIFIVKPKFISSANSVNSAGVGGSAAA